MAEREVVRETREVPSRSGSGGAGWFIAGILIAALIVGGFLLFGGLNVITGGGGDGVDVTIEAPAGGEGSGGTD